jgi:hypothetical protein
MAIAAVAPIAFTFATSASVSSARSAVAGASPCGPLLSTLPCRAASAWSAFDDTPGSAATDPSELGVQAPSTSATSTIPASGRRDISSSLGRCGGGHIWGV